jgi:hypothetical protein
MKIILQGNIFLYRLSENENAGGNCTVTKQLEKLLLS